MEKKEIKLSEEVAKNFELVGTKPGIVKCSKFGNVDLCALTAKDAAILVEAGFPYLKKKDTQESKESKAVTKTD
ncbi:MAG: hypothetical protein H7Y13_11900 [Sphingobacteriaceae bacterium]|nr:hypothetical protein [Sphingobacteriaceae bacterium]